MTRSLIVILCAVLSVVPIHAGDLDDFEKDVSKKSGHRRSTNPVYDVTIGGGVNSYHRVSGAGAGYRARVRPRQPGEALIPYVRVDITDIDLGGDVDGFDLYTEGGYGPVGIVYRLSDLKEKTPPTNLKLHQFYIMLRSSVFENLEIDYGIGAYYVVGQTSRSGGAFFSGTKIYMTDWVGIELRSVWATIGITDIYDNDMAIMIGPRYVKLRAGYRWIRSSGTILNGFYIGGSMHY